MLNFKELLNNPSYLVVLTSTEKDPVTPEQITEALDKAVESNLPVVEAILAEDVSNYEFSNPELLQEAQSTSLNHFGEWNQEAAKLSLAIYLESEGLIIDKTKEDRLIPFAELFGGEAKWTTDITNKEYREMNENLFVNSKEKKTPVTNMGTAKAAIAHVEWSKDTGGFDAKKDEFASVENLTKKFGLYVEKDDENQPQTVLKPFSLNGEALNIVIFGLNDTKEEVAAKIDAAEALFPESKEILTTLTEKFYSKSEGDDSAENTNYTVSVKADEVTLIELSNETVVELLNNKLNEGENTRTLYSIARKLKLSKEEISEATNAYKWASTVVLEKLYTQLPDKREPQSEATPTETITPVGDISTTEEEVNASNDANSSTSTKKSENGSMLNLFQAMNRR